MSASSGARLLPPWPAGAPAITECVRCFGDGCAKSRRSASMLARCRSGLGSRRSGCSALLKEWVGLLAEVASPPVVVPGGSGFAGQTAVAGCLLVAAGGGQAGPPSVDLDQAGFQ